MFNGLVILLFLVGLGLISFITIVSTLLVWLIFGQYAAVFNASVVFFCGLVWLAYSYWETQ